MRTLLKTFDDANDFLDFISPRKEGLFTTNIVNKSMYRGQADSSWEIEPSVFRPNQKLYHAEKFITTGKLQNRLQIEAELYQLEEFSRMANEKGVDIGNDKILSMATGLGEYLDIDNKVGRGELAWPLPELYAPLVLSQHYGLPTRMLDWSYCPYTAAYFAAKSRLEDAKNGKKFKSNTISLFSFNSKSRSIRQYSETDIKSLCPITKLELTYQIVFAPTHNNENLMRQKGVLLTCMQKQADPNELFKPLSFENYIKKHNETNSTQEKILEIRLPASCCAEILRLLSKEGIHAGSLFSGQHGCAESIHERQLWIQHA